MTSLIERFTSSPAATTIIAVACMLFFGFLMTRLTKLLRLPNVTAYIVCGILLGPYVLNVIPRSVVDGMDFIADIALAFIAFSTSEFFKLDTLKRNGAKFVVITLLESLFAMGFVFVLTYVVLGLDLTFSIVLSALATATAPASTMMTIRQTGAKGYYVDTLLLVIALDDVICLAAYGASVSVAKTVQSGSFNLWDVISPILITLAVLVAGGVFGLLLKLLMTKRSDDNRLIVSIGVLFAFCGICALLDVSPLLGCMSMGTVYINLTKDDKLFKQLNYFSPPILLLFFVRSGINVDMGALFGNTAAIGSTPLIIVALLYFIVRIVAKYSGSFLGGVVTRNDKNVRNYLGMALIPQAGVAIGLAATGARVLGGEFGNALQSIILASSVLYELIGPASAKLSLYLSKSYSTDIESVVPDETIPDIAGKNDVEVLIERIQQIQKDLPEHPESTMSEEEKDFLEAYEEQMRNIRRNRNTRRH